jgi:hypothetical protein
MLRTGRRASRLLAAALSLGGLAGCNDANKVETGLIEIKVVPGIILPPLFIDQERFEIRPDSPSTILRHPVGQASLQFERDGRMTSFCRVEIKKNRIIGITLSATGRDPSCKQA